MFQVKYIIPDTYMTIYQPLLTNGRASRLLFPGRSDAPKSANTLRRNISNMLRKELGLHVNPHLFRHLTGYVCLSRNPGHHEDLRRILGHKSLETTINSYAGLEATSALRRYDAIILDLKGEA